MSKNKQTPTADAQPADGALVEVRVLVDCHLGSINDVVTLPAGEAAALQGHTVDAHPAAIREAKAAAGKA